MITNTELEQIKKSKWERKDIWKQYGENFCIEISRHDGRPIDFSEGPNRWAIYAYIYPKHAYFKEFKGSDMFQNAARNLPLHWGPSYLHWHYNDDLKATSVQVGCDYHHLHDSYFTYMGNEDEAREVFSDAEELFNFLTNYALCAPQEKTGEGEV